MNKRLLFALAIGLLASTTLISTGYAANYGSQAASKQDVVDIAVADGNFKTLATLLTKADLISTLKGNGPFTVFAPTDAAFAKLPAETLASLQKPEGAAKLKEILTYHVISGKILSKDLAGKVTPSNTVAGKNLSIDATGKDVMVNKSKVTKADIEGKNGVIHVIDSVLLPQ